MNPRLDFIFSRRSVRQFLDKDIPAAMLHDLVEAGTALGRPAVAAEARTRCRPERVHWERGQ